MYLELASQTKDEIEIYNYYYQTKNTQTKHIQWQLKKIAGFVRGQGKFILELNLLITQNGFSAVKNAGILFQKKINILMEEQGSHIKYKEEKSLTNLIK